MSTTLKPRLKAHPPVRRKKPRTLSHQFAAAVRWLHIYISLFSFTALVFFGLTGITLNHPTWFGAEAQQMTEHEGEIKPEWLPPPPETPAAQATDGDADASAVEAGVDKLAIAEHLRAMHGLRGAVSEFRIDERECLILFKGPAYSADVVVDRETRRYRATVTQLGAVALMNDLHKGRDSGGSWSILIDIVSILTVFLSITGLVLIFYLRRKRLSGLITAAVGTVVIIAVAIWLVP